MTVMTDMTQHDMTRHDTTRPDTIVEQTHGRKSTTYHLLIRSSSFVHSLTRSMIAAVLMRQQAHETSQDWNNNQQSK